MKRLMIILMLATAFIAFSCRSGKDLNIHTNHAKEKDQFKKTSDKKYRSKKKEW